MAGDEDLDIREACRRGEVIGAVTVLLERYGPQLLGYLSATMGNAAQAAEVYSMVAEDLWRGLQGFEWRCSVRAWGYAITRNARSRYLIAEGRRAARERLVAQPHWLRELVEGTRSETPFHLRSEVKQGIRALRARLGEADQTMLMLHVDRGLSWPELVVVLGEQKPGEDPHTAAARLRKRFQALKARLRELAAQEGLLPESRG